MRRVPPFPTLLTLAVLMFAAACGDSRPTAPAMSPGGPNAVISDGSHNGNPDFFFLPPLAPDPRQNPNFDAGKFNAKLTPVVSVCLLDVASTAVPDNNSSCKSTLVTYSGPQVRVFPSLEFYLAVWNLRAAEPDEHLFYRVQVFVGTKRLGFLDVRVVTSLREARNAITGQVIPIPEDFILPIPFRIEQGALGAACKGTNADCTEVSVTPQGGTFFTSTNHAALVLTPGWASAAAFAAGGGSIALTIERKPANSDIPCHSGSVSGALYQEQAACYHYQTYPDIRPYGGFQTNDNVAAQCSTVPRTIGEGGNSGTEEWLLFKSDPGLPLQVLEDRAEPAGLDCTNFAFMEHLPSNPVLRLASLGWHAVTQTVGQVVGVKVAYAWDLGLGGHLLAGDGLSDISWGKGLVATKAADAQWATVGGAVTPTVKINGYHHGGAVSGVPVTFTTQTGSIFAGDAVVTTMTVLTDESGRASVRWQVALGANTLVATAATLDAAPLTFTATGIQAASITDPAGDATDSGEGAPISPDLISGVATLDRGNLVLQLRFAPGTFNPATTMADITIDIDQNLATGFAGIDAAHNDAALMGVEYIVNAGGDYNGSSPTVYTYTNPGFTSVHTGTLTYVTDGMDVTVPLSALGNARGAMNFKVGVQRQLNPHVDGYTGIVDYMTNIGLAPGSLSPPPSP